MRNVWLLVICVIGMIALASCDNSVTDMPPQEYTAPPSPMIPPLPPPDVREGPSYFDLALAGFDDDDIVNPYRLRPRVEVQNIARLSEWVENYRAGIPDRVAIHIVDTHGRGWPIGPVLLVLESDGGTAYTITQYVDLSLSEYDQPPRKFESSLVVRRAYDYIFGYDFPAGYPEWDNGATGPMVVLHSPVYGYGNVAVMRWCPETDDALDGITPTQAQQRVAELFGELYTDAQSEQFITVGAAWMGYEQVLHYVVFARELYDDLEPLGLRPGQKILRAVHRRESLTQNMYAVSLDGRLVFIYSTSPAMGDGIWFLWDDAEQEAIVNYNVDTGG